MKTAEFTPKVQDIICFLDENRTICFSNQDIFKSKKFFDAIRFLRKNQIVIPVCNVCFKRLHDNHKVKCDKNNREHKKSQNKEKHFKLTTFTGGLWALALDNLI